MELKHDATGLGWDYENHTVECDEGWWKEHLAVSGKYVYIKIIYFVLFISWK